ncbi:aminoglycoside phosphotransferase family protein [Verminephrobacter aporrectodeae subsp. tuberculatae]|uniref:phosphotransferase family protein n=1 Tax=Verminephrobacter aporrectodeae TaxID=1110389 RepID=UPI002238DA1E|nr:aminoglycoside phosphotransferase family protein [Verminephrobacter aporrectodeae]MCW5256742.1 aminoglycoside phosphotransferase family protein [Verminephrobacter aporrectodeae subsp. tuberculatae]
MSAEQEWLATFRRAGLIAADETPSIEPLTGGVSSDIVLVHCGERRFCVKRALPRLKVTVEWHAPVERNRSEADWFAVVGQLLPRAVPRIIADHAHEGWFAMEYLPPAQYPLWKTQLRDGQADAAFAASVGQALACIHAATAGRADMAQRFATEQIFFPIRLEAYLLATSEKHPECAAPLRALAQRTGATRCALVHGDVSPKNILRGPQGPVFLDAECAWYGDPAFDLAFCLNHMLLKCLWRPAHAAAFLACFDALAAAYLDGVDWEPRTCLEERSARLLPGLFLARVDGKSPVEYVTQAAQKQQVRALAVPLLQAPPQRLAQVRAAWAKEIGL